MHLQNHYQNAYVTRDLDGALEIFRAQYGFDSFRRMEVSYEQLVAQPIDTMQVRCSDE